MSASRRLLFFFFQAEDGIRDKLVTGVQTCALPIYRRDAPITREICETARALRVPVLYDVLDEPHPMSLVAREYPDVAFIIPHLGSFGDDWRAHERSEERRVGKECRSRGSPDHEKKKCATKALADDDNAKTRAASQCYMDYLQETAEWVEAAMCDSDQLAVCGTPDADCLAANNERINRILNACPDFGLLSRLK